MTKKEYSKQLQDPRWKAKRLEILVRDNHTCTKCGSKEHLQVHHKHYTKGLQAWEYSNDVLMTLCSYCHSTTHKSSDKRANIIEPFVMYFDSLMPLLVKVRSAPAIKLLYIVGSYAEFNTNIVRLTSGLRGTISKEMGISTQQVTNSMALLINHNIVKGSRGDYMLNPTHIYKGEFIKRAKAIKDYKTYNQ